MYELSIPAMSCGHCVKAITRAVNSIDPAAALQFSVSARKVVVDTSVAPDQLKAVLAAAGYPVAAATAIAAEPAAHHCDQCG